jgi:hypothetical protein
MKLEPVLEELEGAAEKLAVKVRYEPLATTVGHGGLCKVNGEYRVIIDKRASTAERVATLAKSLGALDTSGLFLSPRARQTLQRYAA